MNTLEDYKYLWDGSKPEWALVQLSPGNDGEEPRYAVFNKETRQALLIRDNEIYAEVKKKMVESGVDIVGRMSDS